MVAQPAGASWPAAVRPFQRTPASVPVPLQVRTVAPLEPVTATRQRAVELKRAWRPTDPPTSGLTDEAVAAPP